MIPGAVNTPTSGVKPRPGYPVYYNTTRNRWEVPTTAADIAQIQGVLLYRKNDRINDSGYTEYEDNTIADILIRGSLWVDSGAALNPMQRVTWDHSGADWIAGAVPTISALADLTGNAVSDINTGINSLESNINNLIVALGYTRMTNISPSAVSSGDRFEIYLSGAPLT